MRVGRYIFFKLFNCSIVRLAFSAHAPPSFRSMPDRGYISTSGKGLIASPSRPSTSGGLSRRSATAAHT